MRHFFRRAILVCCAALPALSQAEEWAQGVVRRIDTERHKISIEHGEIKNLNMPPMRMFFQLDKPELGQGLQVGDAIAFQAVEREGAFVVIALRKR